MLDLPGIALCFRWLCPGVEGLELTRVELSAKDNDEVHRYRRKKAQNQLGQHGKFLEHLCGRERARPRRQEASRKIGGKASWKAPSTAREPWRGRGKRRIDSAAGIADASREQKGFPNPSPPTTGAGLHGCF